MQVMSTFFIVVLSLTLWSCTSQVGDEVAKPSDVGELVKVDCKTEGTCFCSLPDGSQIASGAKLTMFKAQKAPCGQSCATQKTEVECVNGQIQLLPTHPFLACVDAECQSCELPWGESLLEGQSIPVFKAEKLGCTDSCEANKSSVSCTGGKLVGANLATYKFPSCQLQACADCKTPWGDLVKDGSSIYLHKSESVPCGQSCDSVYRKCVAGSFLNVDVNVYKYKSCSTASCKTCNLPWGGTINNNIQIPTFKKSEVGCSESCLDNGNMQMRVCRDGVLSGDSDFRYANCAPQNCDEGGGAPGWKCRLPWGSDYVLAGTKVSAYTKSSVACGDTCDKYRVTLTCSLLFGYMEGPAGAIYMNCTEDCK